jgi:hypothetical protein
MLAAVSPEISGIPPVEREPNGRPQRASAALRSAMIVRARAAGIKLEVGKDGAPKIGAEMMARLKQPWMGCRAGRAIESLPAEERSQLWGAISDVRRVYDRYWRALGVPSPYPPCARLQVAPDLGDTPPPPRPPSERLSPQDEARVATSAMMAVEGRLALVPWAKGVILYDDPVKVLADFRKTLRLLVGRLG